MYHVLIDSDAKNDIDDQWAITYALCSPELEVVGITAAHFNVGDARPSSVTESYDEIRKIVTMLNREESVAIAKGLSSRLSSGESYEDNEAVQFLIQQAKAVKNLHVIALGPLTNVAAAYLTNPEALSAIKLIWIGGGPWPEGGNEFNLMNDPEAFRIILESPIELHWVLGNGVGSKLKVSLRESETFVRGKREIGDYLHQLFRETNRNEKKIYDLAPVAAVKQHGWFTRITHKAPLILEQGNYRFDGNGREVFLYTDVDASAILDDFFTLMGNMPQIQKRSD